MIRGILFDMDGTLFDTERLYYRCWKKVAKDRGYEIPDSLLDRMRGASLKEGSKVFEAHFNGEKDFWKERENRQKYVYEYLETEGVPLKAGISELFQYMKKNGIRIALATSTVAEVANMLLQKSGVGGYFDAVVTGDMIERGKPEPDIFLLAAEKLSLKPEDCAVCEDSRNGVIAGHRSGAKVFFLPDMMALSEEEKRLYVDECFESLDQIIGYLEAERSGSIAYSSQGKDADSAAASQGKSGS